MSAEVKLDAAEGQNEQVEVIDATVTPVEGLDDTYDLWVGADSSDTADWPAGMLHCKVRFEDESDPPVVLTMPVFGILVTRT